MRRTLSISLKCERGFNPRICKRCDIGSAYIRARKDVSIHASVKDATCQLAYIKDVGVVSIHASVKDATDNRYDQTRD